MATAKLGKPLSALIPDASKLKEQAVVDTPDAPAGHKMTVSKYDRNGDGQIDALTVKHERPQGPTTQSVHLLDADGNGRLDAYDSDGSGAINRFTIGNEGDNGTGWRSESHSRLEGFDQIQVNRRRTKDDPKPMMSPSTSYEMSSTIGDDGREVHLTEELRSSDRFPQDRADFGSVIPGGVVGFLIRQAKLD